MGHYDLSQTRKNTRSQTEAEHENPKQKNLSPHEQTQPNLEPWKDRYVPVRNLEVQGDCPSAWLENKIVQVQRGHPKWRARNESGHPGKVEDKQEIQRIQS